MLLNLTVTPEYEKAGAVPPARPAELKVMLLPPVLEQRKTRPMVIVVPGGGYSYTSDREAEPIALRFMAEGFHAAVLRYSCAPSRWPVAALELAWSIRRARTDAQAWGVDPDRIYVIGFSAGGHLACSVGTLWDREPLAAGEVSCRPDAQVLCYPVITLGQYTHAGSRNELTGGSSELAEALSLEKRVTPQTPATFLWHTVGDGSVPVENSMLYAAALRREGVPFELHIFELGGHGLATADEETAHTPDQVIPDVQAWLPLAVRFLKRRG